MKTIPKRKCKVLPFDTPQGHVKGHEIIEHRHDWLRRPIKHVVFSTFDQQAQMTVEIHVHWTKWTEYAKRKWPEGGSIEAVILEDGQRIHAKSWSLRHYNNEAYLAAPLICRDCFKITTLSGDYTLLEIAGVGAWGYSKRDDAATAEHLIDPWDRDNREFHARMAALQKQS